MRTSQWCRSKAERYEELARAFEGDRLAVVLREKSAALLEEALELEAQERPARLARERAQRRGN